MAISTMAEGVNLEPQSVKVIQCVRPGNGFQLGSFDRRSNVAAIFPTTLEIDPDRKSAVVDTLRSWENIEVKPELCLASHLISDSLQMAGRVATCSDTDLIGLRGVFNALRLEMRNPADVFLQEAERYRPVSPAQPSRLNLLRLISRRSTVEDPWTLPLGELLRQYTGAAVLYMMRSHRDGQIDQDSVDRAAYIIGSLNKVTGNDLFVDPELIKTSLATVIRVMQPVIPDIAGIVDVGINRPAQNAVARPDLASVRPMHPEVE